MICLVDNSKREFNDCQFISQRDIYEFSPQNIDEYINSPSGQKNKEIIQRLIQQLPYPATRIINKQSYISPPAKIEVGVYNTENFSISSNVKTLSSSIINFNSVIGHDTILHSNVVISLGVIVRGNYRIGESTFIRQTYLLSKALS